MLTLRSAPDHLRLTSSPALTQMSPLLRAVSARSQRGYRRSTSQAPHHGGDQPHLNTRPCTQGTIMIISTLYPPGKAAKVQDQSAPTGGLSATHKRYPSMIGIVRVVASGNR